MDEKPVIGVDIDDVLWDLVGAWLQRHNEITDDNVKPSDIKSWDIAQYINKGNSNELFYILEQSDFWEGVKPIDGSGLVLGQLMNDGYDIYIITATPYKSVEKKINRFLDLFPFIKSDQIIITKHKQMIDVDVLIDNYPENLRDASYAKILFDRPHNKSFNEGEIGAVRMSNWKDIYEYIVEQFPIGRSHIGR